LLDRGAQVVAYDPQGMDAARSVIEGIAYAESAYAAAEGADALVLVTEWNEFRSLDLDRLKAAMQVPVFVDLRNVYRPEEMARNGFHYVGIGRPAGSVRADQAEAAE